MEVVCVEHAEQMGSHIDNSVLFDTIFANNSNHNSSSIGLYQITHNKIPKNNG